MNKQQFYALILLLIAIAFTLTTNAAAQDKLEKEFSVSEANVPISAKEFIESLPLKTKIYWFYEIGRYQTSYEAKFKYKRKVYSIEFDTTGNLLDVEIQLKWKDIKKTTSAKLRKNLNATFDKHRINKIQLQLKGAKESILDALILDFKKIPANLLNGYEVVVNGKKDGVFQLYEIFFDMSGTTKLFVQIQQRNTDHLEY